MKTFTSAFAKVFGSYIKLGAIPGHFSIRSNEKMDEFTDDSSFVTVKKARSDE